VEDTGFQSVFDAHSTRRQLHQVPTPPAGTCSGSTCVGRQNQAHPLRLQVVHKLASTLFATPTPYPGAMHIAVQVFAWRGIR
jgi:hypothetical protein